jgi:hypothetical protein
MSLIYQQKLVTNYSDRIKNFLSKVEGIKTENLPEPFLPVVGKNYGVNHPRILFYGWETRNSKDLPTWIQSVKDSTENAFTWFKNKSDFDNFDFVYWRSNFNSDFWSFNLRLLGKFHNLPDWRELYKNPDGYEDILSSFAWANTDSIERYEVTAKGLGGCYESWKKLKEASILFDESKSMFDSLEPNIVILVNWEMSEELLLNGFDISYEFEPKPHLWYYKIAKPDTHFF